MDYRRNIVLTALLWATLFSLAAWAAAAPVSPADLKPRGYVNDFAGVIDPEWQQRLTRLATVLDQKAKAQIAVVTISSLEGEPIEDFANRLFQVWRVGHTDDRGVMLLLVIKDRRSKLEVGYGLEPIIPDGFAGSVLREMRPSLREGNYGAALYAGSSLLAERIAKEAGVTLDDAGVPRRQYHWSRSGPNWFLIVIVLAALFFGAPWWVALLGLSSRGWGGGWGGGGGFGGYDSGGSGGGFGGFGGGSSGGGGASSDW